MGYLVGGPQASTTRSPIDGAATAGQTSIPVPGGFQPGFVDVFVGGARLSPGDYSDADGMQVVLTKPMAAGTQYSVIVWNATMVMRNTKIGRISIEGAATAGQTTFPVPGGFTAGLTDVYIDGIQLLRADYNDSDGANVVLAKALSAGAAYRILGWSPTINPVAVEVSLIGKIDYFAGTATPYGYLKANGASVSRVTYAPLFAVIGITYGSVDGNSFNLPDLRGEFIRGWDDGRGVDASRALGSAQAGGNASHSHVASSAGVGDHQHSVWTDTAGWHGHGVSDPGHQHGGALQTFAPGGQGASGSPNFVNRINTDTGWTGISINGDGNHTHTASMSWTGAHSHGITVNADGIAEARPRNVAMLACIRYLP